MMKSLIVTLTMMMTSAVAWAISGGGQGTAGVGPRPVAMASMRGMFELDVFWFRTLKAEEPLVRLPETFEAKGLAKEFAMPQLSPYVMERLELVKTVAVTDEGSVQYIHKALGDLEARTVELVPAGLEAASGLREEAVRLSAETGSWIVIYHAEGTY